MDSPLCATLLVGRKSVLCRKDHSLSLALLVVCVLLSACRGNRDQGPQTLLPEAAGEVEEWHRKHFQRPGTASRESNPLSAVKMKQLQQVGGVTALTVG